MQIHVLEIVTAEVDRVCSGDAAAHAIGFGEPVALCAHGGNDHGLWQL